MPPETAPPSEPAPVTVTAASRVERVLRRITLAANIVTVVLLANLLIMMLVNVLTGHRDPILDVVLGHG